jgi:hypothetical protein
MSSPRSATAASLEPRSARRVGLVRRGLLGAAWAAGGAIGAIGAMASPAGEGRSARAQEVLSQALETRSAAASSRGEAASPEATPAEFDGQRAYEHLQQLCALGPRISGSPGMARQQELLRAHFAALGGAVTMQAVPGRRHPQTGRMTPMANLVVVWDAEAQERILLCAHYDTRPLPDQDPDPVQRRTGVFVGANDGASGVAVLMELGRSLPAGRLGVDFVLFDAEEFVWDDRPEGYFIGSTHFAREYRRGAMGQRYVAGVLLDMVGDRRLSIYQEGHSATWTDTRPIVEEIWGIAEQLGVKEFIPQVGYMVRDDHLPLRQIGRIPVCDVIDFHYPDRTNRHWHATTDVPANCAPESLEKVGRVMQQWLKSRR